MDPSGTESKNCQVREALANGAIDNRSRADPASRCPSPPLIVTTPPLPTHHLSRNDVPLFGIQNLYLSNIGRYRIQLDTRRSMQTPALPATLTRLTLRSPTRRESRGHRMPDDAFDELTLPSSTKIRPSISVACFPRLVEGHHSVCARAL